MSQQPVWETDPGSLGTVPEGRYYKISLTAVDPDFPNDPTQVVYSLLAGSLPAGVQVQRNGTIEGIPISIADVKGVPTAVSQNTESKFTIRATTLNERIADRTFTMTVTGQDAPQWITDAGEIGKFYDGNPVNYQFEVEDLDPADTLTITLVSGELPPGLVLSESGLLSGFIEPVLPVGGALAGWDRDGTTYAQYPYDFSTQSISKNYEFVLQVDDGKETTNRTFSIFVFSRNSMTADTIEYTADSSYITADTLASRGPYITNYEPDFGRVTHSNFFAYKIEAADPDGDAISFNLATGSDPFPPNLTLNSETGWLSGYLPDIGLTEIDYTFSVEIAKVGSIAIKSIPYEYHMTVVGEAGSEVTWLTPDFLGYLNNGEESVFYVEASYPNAALSYRLKSGAYSRLPQGLTLLQSGNIVGRTSFKMFSLDGGTTTFDEERSTRLEVDPTTFDRTFVITVEAYTPDGAISISKTFTMIINREYDTPFNILYAKALPPREDRLLIKNLVEDTNIFEPALIYRSDDVNFGVAQDVIYYHAFGLSPASIEDYFGSMELNHYNKEAVLGEIRTARALDDNDNVIYEVVYSVVNDNLVNPDDESVSKEVDLNASVINYGSGGTIVNETDVVYPNSFENMRNQVINEVGQVSKVLPRWMLSKQEDGRIIGFTPAWVIAYTNPGQSNLVAYRIQQQYGTQLNLVDFEIDRFTLDNRLTKDWDIDNQEWYPGRMTTFDRRETTADSVQVTADDDRYIIDAEVRVEPYTVGDFPIYETIFDGGSCKFVSPVDNFIATDEYDRYIMFPQRKIVDNESES